MKSARLHLLLLTAIVASIQSYEETNQLNKEYDKNNVNLRIRKDEATRQLPSSNYTGFFGEAINSAFQSSGTESDSGSSNSKGGRSGADSKYPKGIDYVSDLCPLSPNVTATAPECVLNNGVVGAWVCRTIYDIITGIPTTFSACVDPEHFVPTDQCGCCGRICPDPCPCSCDIETGDNAGVLVNLTKVDDNNDDNTTSTDPVECTEPYRAYRLITGPGFVRRPVCVSKCPFVLPNFLYNPASTSRSNNTST